MKFHLSKFAVQKIAELLQIGAGAVELAAALQAAGIITAGSAVVTAIAGVLIALGAAVLQFMDWCNGVDVIVPWVGGPFIKPA